jgi:ribosomal protein S21|tara:strand:+ start:278 stop:481 length:204 start_codon:yes stop_codon:yes gene_type:complete
MKITVRKGNVETALRLFRKKIVENNVLFDYKEKQYHEKKTTKRQRKLAAAKARERKRQGAGATKRLF